MQQTTEDQSRKVESRTVFDSEMEIRRRFRIKITTTKNDYNTCQCIIIFHLEKYLYIKKYYNKYSMSLMSHSEVDK